MVEVSVECGRSIVEVHGYSHTIVWLKKSKIIEKSGNSSHVYLPKDLIGKEVVGVVLE